MKRSIFYVVLMSFLMIFSQGCNCHNSVAGPEIAEDEYGAISLALFLKGFEKELSDGGIAKIKVDEPDEIEIMVECRKEDSDSSLYDSIRVETGTDTMVLKAYEDLKPGKWVVKLIGVTDKGDTVYQDDWEGEVKPNASTTVVMNMNPRVSKVSVLIPVTDSISDIVGSVAILINGVVVDSAILPDVGDTLKLGVVLANGDSVKTYTFAIRVYSQSGERLYEGGTKDPIKVYNNKDSRYELKIEGLSDNLKALGSLNFKINIRAPFTTTINVELKKVKAGELPKEEPPTKLFLKQFFPGTSI